MKGTYLFPQSFIVSAVLLTRDMVQHPDEIGLAELLSSRLSSAQLEKVIRAMNALHTHNRVHAHHAERSRPRFAFEQSIYKLRRLGLKTHRPICSADIEHEWTDLKPETVAMIFSLARVIPEFPGRHELPVDMSALHATETRLHSAPVYKTFERETRILQSAGANDTLRRLVESAYGVAIHEPKFHAMTKGYKALIKAIGSTSPEADSLKDRISAHLVSELRGLHPELDWASYVDYRHPEGSG